MIEKIVTIVDKHIDRQHFDYAVIVEEEGFGVRITLTEQEKAVEKEARCLFPTFGQAVECAVWLAFHSVPPDRLLEEVSQPADGGK